MKAPFDDAASVKLPGPLAAALRFTASSGPQLCAQSSRVGRRAPAPAAATNAAPPAGAYRRHCADAASAVVALMFLDSRRDRLGAPFAAWFTAAFEQITNAGLSGWFLIPSGVVVLCLAAIASPALPRLTQGVLAALAARFGFLFLAIARPSLFTTIIKRLIGRARPYVEFQGSPFTYMPFAWRSEYRKPAVGSRHDCRGGGVCYRGDLAADAAGHVALCARHHVQPRRRSGPSSERRHRRRAGRCGRRRHWCAAVCRPAPGVFATRLAAYPGPSLRRIAAALIGRFAGRGERRSP